MIVGHSFSIHGLLHYHENYTYTIIIFVCGECKTLHFADETTHKMMHKWMMMEVDQHWGRN